MNVRQILYKKNLFIGMSKYAAARAAGYSHATAINATVNIEKRCGMSTELEMAGLTDKALAAHAANGMEAKKTISAIGDADGATTDFVEVEDWPTRFKYFDRILDLRGHKKEPLIDQSNHTHIYSITNLHQSATKKENDLLVEIPMNGNGKHNGNGQSAGDRSENSLRVD